jgi:hypothetical protein
MFFFVGLVQIAPLNNLTINGQSTIKQKKIIMINRSSLLCTSKLMCAVKTALNGSVATVQMKRHSSWLSTWYTCAYVFRRRNTVSGGCDVYQGLTGLGAMHCMLGLIECYCRWLIPSPPKPTALFDLLDCCITIIWSPHLLHHNYVISSTAASQLCDLLDCCITIMWFPQLPHHNYVISSITASQLSDSLV